MTSQGLSDWYRNNVLPSLSVEAVYGGLGLRPHGRYLRGPCPFGCGGSDPRPFSADIETKAYRCFHCDAKGDALVYLNGGERPRGPAYVDAVRRAASLAGAIPPRHIAQLLGENHGSRSKPHPKRAAAKPAPAKTHDRESTRKVRALLRAWHSADGTLAANYLRGRLAWPPDWTVPECVGWIDAVDARRALRYRWPECDWAGCIAFRYSHPAGEGEGIKLEALCESGRIKPRWRKNVGTFAGLRMIACDLDGGRMHVGEGEVTALALAVQCQARGRGMAIAVGGADGMKAKAVGDPSGRTVLIHADGDAPGRDGAWKLREALQANGIQCWADGLDGLATDGCDVADALAAAVRERAAIRELDGGQPRAEALRGAWNEVQAMLADERLEL